MAAVGAINVDCPTCGRELPMIPIKTRLGYVDGRSRNAKVTLISELSGEWWDKYEASHPDCVLGSPE